MAVGIAGSDQHAFAGAYFEDGFPQFAECRRVLSTGEIFLQVRITQIWGSTVANFVRDSQNDITAAFSRIEYAAAIPEFAVRRVHLAEFFFAEIKNQHGSDGLRDFLAVSSNVLH